MEMTQQLLLGNLSNSFNIIEFAMRLRLTALLLVVRYGKTMNLILNLNQQTEQLIRHFHSVLLRRRTIEQHIGTMLVILLQSGNGYMQAELTLQNLADGIHLTLTTIGYNQIG